MRSRRPRLAGPAAAAFALALAVLLGVVSGDGPPAQAQSDASSDASPTASAAAAAPRVVVLDIDGAIGPATSGYVRDGLDEAAESGAALVVLRMDTPGGLSAAMRDIISAILSSPVPVASYIAPTGSRAASAGTYIHYASHFAYMAPGTTLGAATPVQMGGGSTPLPGGSGDDSGDGDDGDPGTGEDQGAAEGPGTATGDAAADGGQPAEAESKDAEPKDAQPADAKTAKAVNDAVAYIRSLAEMRGRNAAWAERAVRQAATLTDRAAVARNVADGRADSVAALVATLDGRTAELETGTVTLDLADARIEAAPPDWRDQLLATITDPNLAFILMMLGIYGLIFEFANPGLAIPGVLGAICLLTGLYALNVLPVSYAGLALIGVGVAFMVAEAFVPSFGALGLGGLAAFALGSTMLFDTGSGAYQLSWWTVFGVTALTGAVLVLVIGVMVGSHRRPVTTGEDTLLGRTADVDNWHDGRGRVRLQGEYWNAVGPRDLAPGMPVRVTGRHGLTLEVDAATGDAGPDRPADDTAQPSGA